LDHRPGNGTAETVYCVAGVEGFELGVAESKAAPLPLRHTEAHVRFQTGLEGHDRAQAEAATDAGYPEPQRTVAASSREWQMGDFQSIYDGLEEAHGGVFNAVDASIVRLITKLLSEEGAMRKPRPSCERCCRRGPNQRRPTSRGSPMGSSNGSTPSWRRLAGRSPGRARGFHAIIVLPALDPAAP
jgi:hypothetical protein